MTTIMNFSKLQPFDLPQGRVALFVENEGASFSPGALTGTGAAYEVDDIVCTLRAHALRFANHVAIEHYTADLDSGALHPSVILSFGQIDTACDSFARAMQGQDLFDGTRHQVVPIISSKHPAAYVAMMATLKLGLAFAPLDPQTIPVARQVSILSQIALTTNKTNDNSTNTALGVRPLLTLMDRDSFKAYSATQPSQISLSLRILVLEDLLDDAIQASGQPRLEAEHHLNIAPIHPEAPAYVIFTSGSTGTSKGIVMSRLALSAGIQSLTRLLPRVEHRSNKMLQFSPIHFDVSLLELFYCFGPSSISSQETPCALVTAPYHLMLQDLTLFLRATGCTHACLTPTVAALVNPRDVGSLAFLACSGEAIPTALVERWVKAREQGHSQTELWGGYGPSETFFTSLRPLDASSIHRDTGFLQTAATSAKDLGPPLPTCMYAVIDPEIEQPVSVGELGELWVAGPQVMNRYLGQDELTSNAFRFDAISGSKWYRTGDLVRMIRVEDGAVEFHCRYANNSVASYVKHNGLRLELEEINSKVSLHPLVTAAHTLISTYKDEDDGKKSLVTFLSLDRSAVDLTVLQTSKHDSRTQHTSTSIIGLAQEVLGQIWSELVKTLPSYMVPQYLIPLSTMPLAQTGKADFRRLETMFSTLAPKALSRCAMPMQAQQKVAGQQQSKEQRDETRVLLNRAASALLQAGVLKWLCEDEGTDVDDRMAEVLSRSQEPLSSFGVDSLGRIRVGAILCQEFGSRARKARSQIISSDTSLKDLAETIQSISRSSVADDAAESASITPLSLSPEVLQHLQGQGIQPDDIEFVQTCSPIQLDIIASQLRDDLDPTGAFDHLVFELDVSCTDYTPDVLAYHEAFGRLVNRHSVLRTLFVPYDADDQYPLAQVTLQASAYLSLLERREDTSAAILYQPCARISTKKDKQGRAQTVELHLSHAVYDGFSLSILLRDLRRFVVAATGAVSSDVNDSWSQPHRYRAFTNFVEDQEAKGQAKRFFERIVSRCQRMTYPRYEPHLLPEYARKAARPDHVVDTSIQLSLAKLERNCAAMITREANSLPIGSSALLQACFASALSEVAHEDRAIYGTLCSGRRLDLEGIDDIVGPTLSTALVHLEAMDDYKGDLLKLAVRVSQLLFDGERHAPFLTQSQQLSAYSGDTERGQASGLSSVLFSLQSFPGDDQDVLFRQQNVGLHNLTGYALVVEASPSSGELGTSTLNLRCRYDAQRVTQQDATALMEAWKRLLSKLCTETATEFNELVSTDLNSETYRQSSDAGEYAGEHLPLPSQLMVHHRLEYQAEATPSKIALQFESSRFVTYLELHMMVEGFYEALQTYHLAKAEQSEGVNHPPPIFIDSRIGRQPEVIAAMLAFGKLGIPFAFVDFSRWPKQMLQSVAMQAKPLACLCSTRKHCEEVANAFPKLAPVFLDFRQLCERAEPFERRTENQDGRSDPDGAFYYAFTSGTTDLFTDDTSHLFAIKTQNRRVFVCLWSGACLCMADENRTLTRLDATATMLRANFAQLTPTVASMLHPPSVPFLTDLILGGEALTAPLARRWADQLRLFNCYGPTECTVIAAMHPVTMEPKPYITIGRAFGYNTIHIMDLDQDKPVSNGQVGELCIMGPQVGSYLHSVSAPKLGKGKRLYRTGDLAFLNGDGTICCLGRKDSELKVRGQRVDASAVVSAISSSSDSISFVCVDLFDVVHELDRDNSNVKLIAFMALSNSVNEGGPSNDASGSNACGVELLRLDSQALQIATAALETCRSRLKAASVPAWVLALTRIPKTSSGKIDTRSLRALARDCYRKGTLQNLAQLLRPSRRLAFVVDSSDDAVQQNVRRLWVKLLGLKRSFDQDASIAQLGGDSITMIKMVSELSSSGCKCTFADLAAHDTFDMLCTFLKGHKGHKPVLHSLYDLEQIATGYTQFSIIGDRTQLSQLFEAAKKQMGVEQANVQDILPATPMQTGLWVVGEQLMDLYFDCFRYTWSWNLQLQAHQITEVLKHVLDTHAILRTRMMYLHGRVFQVVLDAETALARACTLPSTGELSISFDTTKRALSLRIHHSLFDAWSWTLVEEQLKSCFSTLSKGLDIFEKRQGFLPFSSFTALNLDETLKSRSTEYWSSYLLTSSLSPYPGKGTGFQQPDGIKSFSSERIQWNTTSSTSFTKRHGVTLSDIVRSAVGLAIASKCDAEDVLLGVVTSGRAAPFAGIARVSGPCLATVPLRVPVSLAKTESLASLVKHVRQQHIESLPFEHLGLRKIINSSQHKDAREIFDVLLTFVNLEEGTADPDDVLVREREETSLAIPEQPYSLTLEVFLNGSTLSLTAKYDTAILLDRDVFWLLKHIVAAMELIIRLPTSKFAPRMLLQKDEVATISSFAPQTPLDTPFAALPPMLLNQASSLWCKTALVNEMHDYVTYGELFCKSFRGAEALVQRGVGPGQIVPLLLHKGLELYFAIFSVTLTGAAFSNLSLEAPRDLLEYSINELLQAKFAIIDDNAARWISDLVTEPIQLKELMFDKKAEHLDRNSRKRLLESDRVKTMVSRASPSSPCYIGLTSGTSGRPKAVQVSHSNIVAFLEGGRDAFLLKWTSRNLAYASQTFDAFFQDIFVTLLVHGATLVVASKDALMSDLEGLMDSMDVSDTHLTPTVSMLVTPENVPKLRSILITGEQVTPSVRKRWIESGATTQNAYGPSETSVGVTTHSFVPGTSPPFIAIGKSFGDTRLHIVDEELRMLPIGAIGEIVVTGTQVASYLRSGSKDAFVPSPFVSGKRLYRTGDLGRLHGDGSFECLGRRDFQVKLHGQRIETESVVSVILEAGKEDQLREATVHVLTIHEQQRLVAFVAFERDPAGNQTAPASEAGRVVGSATLLSLLPAMDVLRTKVATRLPSYMCPSLWVPVTSLPRNASNKLDRRALELIVDSNVVEALASAERQGRTQRLTATPIEELVRKVWAQLLCRPAAGIYVEATYSSYGIDSLGLIRLNALLREAGLHTSVSLLVAYPTIASFATVTSSSKSTTSYNAVGHQGHQAPSLEAPVMTAPSWSQYELDIAQAGIALEDVEDVSPASLQQRNLYAAVERDAEAYRSSFEYKVVFKQGVDVHMAMRTAWSRVLAIHPILRVLFVPCSDAKIGFLQVLRHKGQASQFVLEDKETSYGDEAEAYAVLLLQLPADQWYRPICVETQVTFTLRLSHLCYDGWSMAIIEKDLDAELSRFLQEPLNSDITAETSVLQPSYLDFTRHYLLPQRKQEAIQAWANYLRGARPCLYPAPLQTFKMGSALGEKVSSQTISSDLNLTDLATRLQASPAVLLQAALAIVLSQHDEANTDVLFGLVASGRMLEFPGIENIVGPCMVTVPLRSHVDPSRSLHDFLQHTTMQFSKLIGSHYVDIGTIIRASPFPTLARLFSVLLAFVDQEEEQFSGSNCLERVATESSDAKRARRLYDVQIPCIIEASIKNGRIGLVCIHDEDAIASADATVLLRHVLTCLEWMQQVAEDRKNVRIGRTCLADSEERASLETIAASTPHSSQELVLDAEGQLCPLGVAGQIFVSVPISNGHEPACSKESTVSKTTHAVSNPWQPGHHIHPTGQLGRRRADGRIEYLGLKIPRIVLNEQRIDGMRIEKVIDSCSGVAKSLVFAANSGASTVLVAAVAIAAQEQDCSSGCLIKDPDILKIVLDCQEACLARFPPPMLPSFFIPLHKLPTRTELLELMNTENLERVALRATSTLEHDTSRPINDTEEVICSELAKVLQLKAEHIGANVHFARLGADSLTLMRLSKNLRTRGLDVSVKTLMQFSDVSQLATAIDRQELWYSKRTHEENSGETMLNSSEPDSASRAGSVNGSMCWVPSSSSSIGALSSSLESSLEETGFDVPSSEFYIPVSLRTEDRWLFMVHDYSGFVQAYSTLAENEELIGTYNICSIMDPNIGARTSQYPDMRSLALAYLIGALRFMLKYGRGLDLTLGGWSFGGTVAFEMAYLWRTSSEQVLRLAGLPHGLPVRLRAVVMLDTFLWPPSLEPLAHSFNSEPRDERERLLAIQRDKAEKHCKHYWPAMAEDSFKICLVKAALQDGWEQRPRQIQEIETSPFNGWDQAISQEFFLNDKVSGQHATLFDADHAKETNAALAKLLSKASETCS
ncbi:nonribosomal peptide synthase [Pseudozyma hubeiensis SY62]|uniref:Nonribosomal peptide synthase n=1 Tax=Pseudozyma hubeiensis (strain SY62) TaxID=1305764 RepID=R9P345_PSEHS|nr:nonribosomal peptide synthase [Pseudozyma hubeiensis SY62]GAC95682.1 nonribosomal peptide synthase [Pseudozyma hubeiensis SY62]